MGSESYKCRLEEQSGKHYVCSFSELPDSIYFWLTNYANENGIALRLKTSACEFYDRGPCLSRVRYFNVESIDQLMPDFVNMVREDSKYIDIQRDSDDAPACVGMNGAQVLGRCPFSIIKNKIWEPEKEWRMVRSLKALSLSMAKRSLARNKVVEENDKELEDDWNAKEFFKVDDYGIPRYYVNMPNPFDEIILGPSFSKYYVDSVKNWLEEHKYHNVKVSLSKARLRHKP